MKKASYRKPLLTYFMPLVSALFILNVWTSIQFHLIQLDRQVVNYLSPLILNAGQPAEYPPRLSPNLPTPTSEVILKILKDERKFVNPRYTPDDVVLERFANIYELTYALMNAFQRNNIAVFLGFGSQLGARRHHGVIPFGDKDVDLTVFSKDEERVYTIIDETIKTNKKWGDLCARDHLFGFQLKGEALTNFSDYYIDFWMYNDHFGEDKDQIRCVGRTLKRNGTGLEYENGFGNSKRPIKVPPYTPLTTSSGCELWYKQFHLRPPQVFERNDYFPPTYQVFGSHKVTIPAKSCEIETFGYGHETNWNETCGSHRKWNRTSWIEVPASERQCTHLYDKYPFVFSLGDGREELKQGGVVLHRSRVPMPSSTCKSVTSESDYKESQMTKIGMLMTASNKGQSASVKLEWENKLLKRKSVTENHHSKGKGNEVEDDEEVEDEEDESIDELDRNEEVISVSEVDIDDDDDGGDSSDGGDDGSVDGNDEGSDSEDVENVEDVEDVEEANDSNGNSENDEISELETMINNHLVTGTHEQVGSTRVKWAMLRDNLAKRKSMQIESSKQKE